MTIEIYGFNLIEPADQYYFNLLISLLPEKRRDELVRKRDLRHRYQSLMAEIFVKTIAYKKYHYIPNIVKEKNGKPCFLNISDLNFNISHSGEWVVCALDSLPIGIDIEIVKEAIDFDLAKVFLTPLEYVQLLKAENKKSFFYELWTLKESYLKATGKGLTINPGTLELLGALNYPVNNGFYFRQYNQIANYKISVCAKNSEFPGNIIFKSFDQVYKDFLNS